MSTSNTIHANFILGHPLVKPSTHFTHRLKKRVKLKKEKARHNFIKKLAKEAYSIYDIPKEKFDDFCSYMYSKIKYVQRKNIYTCLVLYEKWFILASYSGDLITLYEIDKDEYKDIYYKIKEERSKIIAA